VVTVVLLAVDAALVAWLALVLTPPAVLLLPKLVVPVCPSCRLRMTREDGCARCNTPRTTT
jgi:hypothetical protein